MAAFPALCRILSPWQLSSAVTCKLAVVLWFSVDVGGGGESPAGRQHFLLGSGEAWGSSRAGQFVPWEYPSSGSRRSGVQGARHRGTGCRPRKDRGFTFPTRPGLA